MLPRGALAALARHCQCLPNRDYTTLDSETPLIGVAFALAL